MKTLTPDSDQVIDVEGSFEVSKPVARTDVLAAVDELKLPAGLRSKVLRLASLVAEVEQKAHLLASRAIECGKLLLELTAEQGIGHGGDRRGQNFKVSRDTLKLSVEEIALAIGISRKTAYRYVSLARAVQMFELVEASPIGETITVDGRPCQILPELRQKAASRRAALYSGELALNRAMPAAMGIFAVNGGAGTGGKAATNHYRNCETALIKLATSVERYHSFSDEERAKLDLMLRKLLSAEVFPERWHVIYQQVTKGGAA